MGADVASNHRESAIVMKSRTVPVVLALVSALTALPAAADSGLFLNLPPVKGLSTDETHKGWLDIDSLQWSVGVGVRRNTSDSEVSIPSASSIVWSQSLDSTYPQLLQRLVAAPGGVGRAEHLDPEDEQDRGDDVGDVDQLIHGSWKGVRMEEKGERRILWFICPSS